MTFDAGKIQDIKIVKNAENPILAKKSHTQGSGRGPLLHGRRPHLRRRSPPRGKRAK
ncbi:MAG: hypothetical protein ACLS58_09715 [Sutterella wadsworthensis]